MLTNSWSCLLKAKLHTCEPVSFSQSSSPVKTFLNLIILSAVPPPEARSPCCWGDQANALTAARWSVYLLNSCPPAVQTPTLLSFPPEASICSSADHFSPQIYWLCSCSFDMKSLLDRLSRNSIFLSLDPVASTLELQAKAPTLV